jgi:hypothetical protein
VDLDLNKMAIKKIFREISYIYSPIFLDEKFPIRWIKYRKPGFRCVSIDARGTTPVFRGLGHPKDILNSAWGELWPLGRAFTK